MGPFNIKIGFGKNEVALKILPAAGHYVILYYDCIVGAIKRDEEADSWEQVPDENIAKGHIPFYEPDLNADRLDFVLCEHTINYIGEEITAFLKDNGH
ncbi:hypothetical protein ABDJ41_18395 [Pedobacter sp. ASV1-7]|uniref:hypothetical protein n=1 Tax=Pedobacter sp. ASV1-7 TaxID=3145237 RepID=UPI0032E880C3